MATQQMVAAPAETSSALARLAHLHLAVICPMANEGHEGVRFVREVLPKTEPFGRVDFFAIIDKATKDDTRELLENYSRTEPRLTVVWAPENKGAVDAYVRGYREALDSGADWILEIDAGFSHDPEDIPKFWPVMLEGYDCVFGSRFMRGGAIVDSSRKRYWISKGGTILSNVLLGTRLKDMTSGFELFSRNALSMVMDRGIHSRAHFFQTEIKTYCHSLKIVEVPITYRAASPRLKKSAVDDAFSQLWRLFKMRLTRQL